MVLIVVLGLEPTYEVLSKKQTNITKYLVDKL